MAVKPGSQQTEVGVIPIDWEVAPLATLTAFISHGFTVPMPVAEHGIYLITARDIYHGKIQFDSARRTTEVAYNTLLTAKSRPQPGDILLTKDGTLGRLALVDTRRVCINQSVAILRPNSKTVPEFLKVALEAQHYQRRMLQDAGGSAIQHISISIVNRMPMAVPPLAEQAAIAKALCDADAFLQSLEALLAKKRQLRQGASEELLTGKRRLPGFRARWKVQRLGELATVIPAGIYGQVNPGDGLVGMPVATTAHLSDDDTWNDNAMQVRYFAPAQLATYTVQAGDVIIAKSSGSAEDIKSGKASLVTSSQAGTFVFSSYLMALRPKAVLPEFLYFHLTSSQIKRRLPSMVETSIYPNLRVDEYLAMDIAVPSAEEQAAIAMVITDIEAEITAAERELAKVRQLNEAMRQELLTGRIRLV